MTTKKQLKTDLFVMTAVAVFFAALSIWCAFEILNLRDQISAIVGGAL
tara:strand:+ start:188 stop:331 length:144 start_codon:yes stop_codon:yes gene_type:complete